MLIPLMVMVFGLISMKTNSSIISLNNYSTQPISFLKNQIEAFQDSLAVGIKLKSIKNPTHYESIGKLNHESLNVQVGELSYEFTGIKSQQEYLKVLSLVEALRPNSTLNKKYENAYPYYAIDHKPEPKIGWEAWENYLTSKIPAALIDEIHVEGGNVELEFVINQEAKVVNASIKKSLGQEIDQILLAALTNTESPAWQPGKNANEIKAVIINAKIEIQKLNQNENSLALPTKSKTPTINGTQDDFLNTFPENLAIKVKDDLKSGAITLGNPFKNHLAKMLSFPKGTIKEGISGTAIVRLKTSSEGDLTDISFIQSISPQFEESIINVLKDAPNLIPVLQKNEYELFLPISFKINRASINNVIPSLDKAYGDVIYINGFKAQEKRLTSDPLKSPGEEIPVHILKEGLVSFNGVAMPINSSLSDIINVYIGYYTINPQLIIVGLSAGKNIKMGEVQNVQAALKKAGINKLHFYGEANQTELNPMNTPVFIIDGILQVNPDNMDYPKPEEIDSISMVSSDKLHLYGEKAKNGAIVIKTKQ